MRVTLDLPKSLHEQIMQDKRRIGISKSDIMRQILKRHYELKKELKIVGAA